MGGNYSQYVYNEQQSWKDHSIKFDDEVRKHGLNNLDAIGNDTVFYISYTKRTWCNIKYQHWFIFNGEYCIEFGSHDADINKAIVTIQPNNQTFKKNQEFKMNDDIRERIKKVLGMNNYSLLLRNSEHVVNYISKNNWVSIQMSDCDSFEIFSFFFNKINNEQKKILNTFPSCLRPYILNVSKNKKIYSFLTDYFNVTKFDYYLDDAYDTYNILMVGPTGAGKSHLINIFFNQYICDSDASLKSVTHDIYFVRGEGEIYDKIKKKFVTKSIIVADTIGLCDADWEDRQVISIIKNRITTNIKYIDAVFIVFRASRLSKECTKYIKKVLAWLDFKKNSTRFVFVGTHADFLSEENKVELKAQFKEIFKIKSDTDVNFENKNIKFDSFIFTGFPPENKTHSNSQEMIEKSLNELSLVRKFPGEGERIEIMPSSCTCL